MPRTKWQATLCWSAQAHGEALTVQVSEQFVVSRIRTRQDHQRMHVASCYDLHNKKLVRMIVEMERHSEQPLPCKALAERVGINVRQLERLFRHHLHRIPSAFYLGLRL